MIALNILMRNKLIYIVLLTLLISDFTWSFIQYYTTMLDGDMAGGILPNEQVRKVLSDPFGFGMLTSGEAHVNPNRFFPHFIFKYYFRTVPQFLQLFVSPVESIYLAAAIIKLFTHIFIVYFLSAIATKSKSVYNLKLIFVAVLLTSLFQTYGYNTDIGIIDISITYVFFYALPVLLLLFFIYLVYFSILNGKIPSRLNWALLVLLTFILPFTGGIIPPTIILLLVTIVSIYLLKFLRIRNQLPKEEVYLSFQSIPRSVFIFCSLIAVLSAYSLFIGSFDNQFTKELIPVSERYKGLLIGFQKTFLSKSGFSSLFQLILINSVYLIIFYKSARKNLIMILIGVLIFSTAYIILLPLGGYRPYRPNIIRYDSIMPVTLALFFLCGFSTIVFIQNIKSNKIYLSIYLIIIGIFIFSYTKKDDDILLNHACEKGALNTISRSKTKIVELENDCYILSWWEIRNYKESIDNGKMLKILGVTKESKMYYSIDSNK